MSRGLSLVELLVGIVTATVVGLVSAHLFRLGLTAYHYGVRQADVMTNAAKAQDGEGAVQGMLWALRAAHSVQGVAASSVTVVSSFTATTGFRVDGSRLVKDVSGVSSYHAKGIEAMTVQYYGIDGSGLVFESTSSADAAMVTTLLSVRPTSGGSRVYTFFTGARLRNRP